jgi:hypothetical protein
LKAGSQETGSGKSALAHTMNFASGGELDRFFPYGKVVALSVIGDPCGKKAFKGRLRNDTSYQQNHGAFLKRVSLLSGLFPKGGHTPFGAGLGCIAPNQNNQRLRAFQSSSRFNVT